MDARAPTPPGAARNPARRRTAALAALAAAVHLAFDAAQSAVAWLRPPYLRFEDMPEAFRELPFVSAPVAVSVASAAAGGVLAAIALAAVEERAPRRRRLLVLLVTGFWLFSAVLSWGTWLSTPFLAALPGILMGVPRGLAIGWLLWRLSPPRLGAPRG